MLRNNVLFSQGKSVLSGFLRNWRLNPDASAVHINNATYSYAQMMNLAASTLEHLQSAGAKNHQFIGLYTDHSVYTYASILAILMNGSGYVPLNNKFPPERNGIICDEAQLHFILGGKGSGPAIDKIREHATISVAHIDNALPIPSDSETFKIEPAPVFEDDFVYMMFTSGSTGKPKGVPISHKNVSHYLHIMTECGLYDFKPDDRFIQAIELTFDMSILGIFVAWEVGACIYPAHLTGLAYLSILKTIQDNKITVSYMVPSVVTYAKRYLDAGEINLSSLRYSFFAGESLLMTHVTTWEKSATHSIIENVFGPTEATNTFLRYRWNKDISEKECVNGAVPIGDPNPGIATVVVTEAGELAAAGVKGELYVYGPQVAQCYWKDPSKTDSSFVFLKQSGLPNRWYKTGDLVYLNDQGHYIYCGRCDSQIKINGFRVELGEIEHHIRKIVNLESVAVIYNSGSPDGLFAFVEAEKTQLNQESILSKLASLVPDYMIPKKIILLDRMPLNINGKIDRNALKLLLTGN